MYILVLICYTIRYMNPNPRKPALILDDTPKEVIETAILLRGIAGVDVQHLLSIPKFQRENGIHHQIDVGKEQSLRECAKALIQYSAVIVDNSFTDGKHERFTDGWVKGIDFLLNTAGPALQLIPEDERPRIVCFSPSNQDTIDEHRKTLWDKFGISSYHKYYDRPLIALSLMISERYGTNLSDLELLRTLGFKPGDDYEKVTILLNIGEENSNRFSSEGKIVEGPGDPEASWEKAVDLFSRHMDITAADLVGRIETAVETRRANIEGSTIGRKERA